MTDDPVPARESAVTKTGIPVRNLWHMLLYHWNAFQYINQWNSDVDDAPTLDTLLATVLANQIEQRLRIGPERDYRSHNAEVTGLRGRIIFSESLKRMSFPRGRTFCQYEHYTVDVPANQIIRSTMVNLIRSGEFGTTLKTASQLRSRLRRLVLDLDAASLIELSPGVIRREQLKRHDRDYSLMLAICYMLSRTQMPTELADSTTAPQLDRDTLTLYEIYERFVARFYAHHLNDWTVSAQKKQAWPAEEPNDYLPTMVPDIVLQHQITGQLVVIDTKFTPHILKVGQYDKLRFDRNHLFQIYAYVKSQEHQSDNHRSATGLLLYPAVNHRLSESVTIQGHSIGWDIVDLAQPWQQIEKDLLAIPAKLFRSPS